MNLYWLCPYRHADFSASRVVAASPEDAIRLWTQRQEHDGLTSELGVLKLVEKDIAVEGL